MLSFCSGGGPACRLQLVLLFVFGALTSGVSAPHLLYAEDQEQTPSQSSAAPNAKSILDLDIEQLGKIDVRAPALNVEVTSVSKQESTVGRSAAAIFVITQEMIRRSGCNNIPDLLRLVPGLEVARINAHQWAISSRGFNDYLANKLLVLIDGRTVYTPLYGGVFWDVQDLLLEDIERIEVIRGPGGTLWGANAVNGVINIITKKAKDTQGALVTYGGGSEDLALGGARVGGNNGGGLYWRVYGKHFERSAGFSTSDNPYDAWRQGRAGFRADWEPEPDGANLLTVQGDYYLSREGNFAVYPLPVPPYSFTDLETEVLGGGNILARWSHFIDDESDWRLQTYFDRAQSEMFWRRYNVNTFDVDFQHRFPLGRRHKIIWGADYRYVHDDTALDGFSARLTPAQKTTSVFSMFVQDEIILVEDRLSFTVGSEFEHNDYTGFEYQPSGRVLFTPDNKRAFWGAVSRAVHVPTRYEADSMLTVLPQPLPFWPYQCFPRWSGNPNLLSEELIAYEIGYRAQPHERFSYDISLFYNQYEHLAASAPEIPYFDEWGNLIIPFQLVNGSRGEGYGVELFGQWTVSERWRLGASYTFFRLHVHTAEGLNPLNEAQEGYSPRNQVRLISYWDIGRNWRFDGVLRYVDNLPSLGVPSYITIDLRLAWQPRQNLEVAVIGRNLPDDHHVEFTQYAEQYPNTEIKRSVFGSLTWRY